MKAAAVIAPTQLAYVTIPADELRSFVDGLFPKLATYPAADSLAAGQGHRYVAGHDLFVDVPSTVANEGTVEGTKHAGHILLTDFPTKAGIPIPGLSESGLGHLLEQVGIHRGWLQVNLCEAGLGILAVAEGSPDLIQAIHGALLMDVGTFFDTFVEGGIEVGISIATENPILLAGGLENIAAGIISTWNTIVVHVDPFAFLGSAATSAIIGFAVASGLVRSSLGNATIAGIRSGIVGSLFAVSPAFGFGALAGFVLYTLGGKLATLHDSRMQALLSVNDESYRQLVIELSSGNVNLHDFIERASPQITFLDRLEMLPTEYMNMGHQVRTLPDDSARLVSCYHSILSDTPSTFLTDLTPFSTEQQT
jgi:hypothetical protein